MAEDIRVLLVESKLSEAERVSASLTSMGVEVFHASTIRQAFRLFRKEAPQVILQKIDDGNLDVSVRLIQRIKSIDFNATFIVISASPSLESVVQSLKVGASDYLIEPINLPELEMKIRQICAKKSVQRENTILSELAALHEITLSFFSTHRMADLLPLVLETCMQIARADSGSVMFWYETEPHLRIEHSKGVRKTYRKDSMESSSYRLAEWVCNHNKPVLVANGKMVPETGIPVERGMESSALCLPLATGTRKMGVINLSRRAALSSFAHRDLSVAEVLANQASIAFANADSYQGLTRRVDNLREIQNVGESLMRLTERNDIVDFVLGSLVRAFGAEIGAILMPIKRRFEFHICSTRKMAANMTETVVNTIIDGLPEGVKVARQRIRTIQRMGAVSKQSFLEQRIIKHNSFEVCPLQSHEKWVGALYVGSSRKNAFDANARGQLFSIAHQTCVALMNARLYEEIKENHLRTIKALAIAVDAKDKYTRGHSENVMKYAIAITEKMGILDPRISEDIQNSALLHDIGKIGIPGSILNKPGSLTREEFEKTMKTHVHVGANIIQEIPFLSELVPLVLHHHERYDGGGYPGELKGDNIPVGARILTVADSFEAMTSNRPYRKALSMEEACSQLEKNKGTQFDPQIVEIFLGLVKRGSVTA